MRKGWTKPYEERKNEEGEGKERMQRRPKFYLLTGNKSSRELQEKFMNKDLECFLDLKPKHCGERPKLSIPTKPLNKNPSIHVTLLKKSRRCTSTANAPAENSQTKTHNSVEKIHHSSSKPRSRSKNTSILLKMPYKHLQNPSKPTFTLHKIPTNPTIKINPSSNPSNPPKPHSKSTLSTLQIPHLKPYSSQNPIKPHKKTLSNPSIPNPSQTTHQSTLPTQKRTNKQALGKRSVLIKFENAGIRHRIIHVDGMKTSKTIPSIQKNRSACPKKSRESKSSSGRYFKLKTKKLIELFKKVNLKKRSHQRNTTLKAFSSHNPYKSFTINDHIMPDLSMNSSTKTRHHIPIKVKTRRPEVGSKKRDRLEVTVRTIESEKYDHGENEAWKDRYMPIQTKVFTLE
ncbi:unnamed protein product [Moneuplotes crassus]|uniref:Uncharacterized protein n=1 Tax=Euplotes crassus TaxID=5936 RepID=A0AAD1U902_EUPCR|nr:unnamed protein product [Moneuplotes crassus]